MTAPDPRHNQYRQAGRDEYAPGDKPLLRGWFHAVAAVAAVVVSAWMLMGATHDRALFVSVLIFGISMVVLYLVSSVYHIGNWRGRRATLLRAFDHANIFVLIAGTYTPFCVNVLQGWLRVFVLTLIWTLAAAGVATSVLTLQLPRWVTAGLYLGMGWIAVVPMPSLMQALPMEAMAFLFTGGMLYTIGAVIYALKRPNPLPRVFGFHEIFHLFVIGGSAAFTIAIWGWVVPFQRL